jgi:hypothetical protein
MVLFAPESRASKDERALAELNDSIIKLTGKLEIVQLRLRKCFRDDGSITPTGLMIELADLDVKRRSETDPTDAHEQTLIQGQQNALVKLMGLRDTYAQQEKSLNDQLEREHKKANEVTAKIQRRKPDA